MDDNRDKEINKKVKPFKVLIVDDDPTIFSLLEKELSHFKLEVHTASNLQDFFSKVRQHSFDVVITELHFSELPGLVLTQKIILKNRDLHDHYTAIIITSSNRIQNHERSLIDELETPYIVQKPVTGIKLIASINTVLKNREQLVKKESFKKELFNMALQTRDLEKVVNSLMNSPLFDQTQKRHLSILFYEAGEKFHEALSLCDESLKDHPKQPALLHAKGRMLLQTNNPHSAATYLDKADSLAPQNLERLFLLAKAYLESKNPRQAILRIKALIEFFPENKQIKFDFLGELRSYGFVKESIELAKEITVPEEVTLHYNNSGVEFSKKGKISEAIMEYQTALSIYPQFHGNYRIYYNIAIAETRRNSFEGFVRAKEALELSLKFKPDFDKAKSMLAAVAGALNEHSQNISPTSKREP